MTNKRMRKISGKVILAEILAVCLLMSIMAGCGSSADRSAAEGSPAESRGEETQTYGSGKEDGNKGGSEDANEATSAAEAAADAAAPDGDISQTVTVKADAAGHPTEVRVKDSRLDLEEKADPAALPFAVRVQYFLDGTEMTADEIAGKSGHVTLRFSYENKAKRTAVIDGKSIETQVPFVFISAVILPEDTFSNVDVKNGSVSAFKNNTIAFGYALPGIKDALAYDALKEKLDDFEIEEVDVEVSDIDVGEDGEKKQKENKEEDGQKQGDASDDSSADGKNAEDSNPSDDSSADGENDGERDTTDSGMEEEENEPDIPEFVEIEADAEDFRLDFTATVVMNGLLRDADLTITDDVKELQESMETFTDAGDLLQEGTEKLSDGADEYGDYLKKYIDGVGALEDGAGSLADALSALGDGLSGIDLNQALPGVSGDSLSGIIKQIEADGKTIADELGGLEELKKAAEGKTPGEIAKTAEEAAQSVAESASEAAAKAVYESLEGTGLTDEERAAAAEAASTAAAQAADRSYALFEAAASEDGTAKPIPAAPDTDEEDASGNQKEYKQSVRFIVETEEIKADSPHSHSDIDISARS